MFLPARLVAVLATCSFLFSCSEGKAPSPTKMFGMGERIQVGTLIYTVLDTEWLDHVGDAPTPRMPKDRFFLVRISVTNSGAAVANVPAMTLTDPTGKSHAELSDGIGVPEWLGYVRSVKPAETLHGRVLFDVPTSAYQLKLADDANPENERFATVELPLQLGHPQVPVDAVAGK